MTTLAHQLKRLALPQNDSSLFQRVEAASLLYDRKEAANIDRETFYALGCTGLEELIGIDPAFDAFEETLFSHASKSLERSVQTKAVNQKLDESISLFLIHLSPYFMLKPAHKCLEWLIHRFHIHLYNQDSLIGCVLPYHETKVFVRVIQLLRISDPTHKWNWLHPIQAPGVPLARGTLITHCYKDMDFMEFICKLVTKSIKVFSEPAGSAAKLRVLLSFYVSTIVAALDSSERVSDTLVAKLLPYVQKGLKSPLEGYQAATYMIICQLSVKTVMAPTLVKALGSQVSKSLVKTSMVREGLSCLIILLQNQQSKDLGKKPFFNLCKVPDLITLLQAIAFSFDTTPLLEYLMPNLASGLFPTTALAESSEEVSPDTCKDILQAMLRGILLENNIDKLLARTLLDEFLSYGEMHQSEPDRISELGGFLLPLIRLLESRYPDALDSALANRLKDVSDKEKQDLFHSFISLSTSGGKYELLADCDTSLLLSLNHPQAGVRQLALQHLKDIIETSRAGFDESFIQEAILARLADDNLEVVMSALSAFKLYHTHLSTEVAVSSLLNLFERVDLAQDEDWYKALEEATVLLVQQTSIKDNEAICNRVILTLIPYMVFTNSDPDSSEQKLALYLAKSGVCDLHPLMNGWPEALEEVLKNAKPAQILGLANSSMVHLLSKNMSAADSPTSLQMVDDMIQALEKDSDKVRQKVSFHVLSHALVQGCCSLREHRAVVSVFQLLDKRLRKMDLPTGEARDKWHLDDLSGKELQIQLLTEYIKTLNAVQSADMEEAVLLMLLLRNFISNLRRPESFPKDSMWWNPETMDNLSRVYLQLLIGLFEVIIWGASEGPYSANFKALMGSLFLEHLKDHMELFRFLSVLWTYSCNLSKPLDCTVNALLQTRALYIGHTLLASQAEIKKRLASPTSPVVVSLLINLTCPVREVRRAAITCLQDLSTVTDSPFLPVLQGVVEKTEEIVADSTFVILTLGSLFEELQPLGSQKSTQKISNAMEHLLSPLELPSCPSYVKKSLMKVLRDANGEALLAHLLPVLKALLEKVTSSPSEVLRDEALLLHYLLGKFNEHSASLLAKNPESLQMFIQALQTTQITHPGMPSFQVTALGQITKAFFAALEDGNVQQKILGVLFDLLLNSKNVTCAQAVSSAFKSISVSASHISAELEPPGREKTVTTVRQTRRQKMQLQQRKSQAPSGTADEGSINWPRTTLILELLQHKKKLREPHLLVPTLFYLLSRCLEPTAPEQENSEYTKQLILSCLLGICQKVSQDEENIPKEVLDEEKFNVELIVQCVRTSEMPQTHHHALLLLGTAAGIFPEKVLHNIMPIFTFMGASVMRLDDTYSFQVISKTVQTVIPALIQAGEEASEEEKEDMEKVVGNIIHVFVDALPHVPEHRRLPILSQLIDTIGAKRFLWMLLVLVFQQHVTKTVTSASNGEKDAVLERDTEFWISVCCEFSAYDQLDSLIKLLQFLSKLPENKDEGGHESRPSRAQKQKPQNAVDGLFSLESNSAKQLRHFKFLSVSFMAQLLASHSFVAKVVKCEAARDLEKLEQRLLEEVLCYINLVARSVEGNADKPTAKFWRALLNKSYEMLDKVNALLPTETFIPVIRGLMSNQLPSVRRKAMDLLNNKLQHRSQWQEDQIELLLGLIKDLLCIVNRKPSVEEEEQAINRQTALYSMKLLCKCFGSQRPDVFVPVLNMAVNLISADIPEEKNVMGSALLCIAEITSTVKALAIPQLPRLMPALLSTLKHKKELLSSEIHLLSTVTALQKVVETLPHFLSPYLQECVLQVARLDKISSKVGPTSQLAIRVTALKTTLATKLAARVVLPTITKCYCQLADTQQKYLGSLMDILQEHIAIMDKQQLSSHQSELTTFFMKALDYRAEHPENDLEQVGNTEGHILNCLIIMVMKLSEVTFRPLFFKLFDWAKTEGSSKDRVLTFCRLADCIADKLKGLFTLFAGNLVKPFAEILNQINTSKTDDAYFDSDNNVEKSCLILEFVLSCLHKIFLYDTQHFVSKERAEALMMPLVDQLENLMGGDEKFQMRVSSCLVPCIAQFSVAMADDSLWKPLNYQILLKMRHSFPKVRFAALLALTDLVEKLRENYMVLLPESIPFLAELMEDENEEVEHQCQKTIKQMETILGESLQSYF
ncbi:HEAT repeat-containing protein 1 [Spea bombifrons]|uniref:HEAT repeat-containing protein 1 n=1 Tax=Spea bombifrons TaxID=233779 RepID=UPI0023498520|nr:HEAT repeat-containing protein 1 [Spea bombifrons]